MGKNLGTNIELTQNKIFSWFSGLELQLKRCYPYMFVGLNVLRLEVPYFLEKKPSIHTVSFLLYVLYVLVHSYLLKCTVCIIGRTEYSQKAESAVYYYWMLPDLEATFKVSWSCYQG